MSDKIQTYGGHGNKAPQGSRFAIVSASFNDFIVDRLVDGSIRCLGEHGVTDDRIVHARVPGAWELPLAASRFVKAGYDAVIVLGAVIRGDTPHFDFVAGEASRRLSGLMMQSGIPIAFGLLTTDTVAQAVARSTAEGNKGRDVTLAALQMVSLGKRLEKDGL